jgi:hypothetical protein
MSQTYKGPLPNIRFSHEIEEIIKSLKAKHSYGYNEIPATILKVSAPFLSYAHHSVLSRCMVTNSRLASVGCVATNSWKASVSIVASSVIEGKTTHASQSTPVRELVYASQSLG